MTKASLTKVTARTLTTLNPYLRGKETRWPMPAPYPNQKIDPSAVTLTEVCETSKARESEKQNTNETNF